MRCAKGTQQPPSSIRCAAVHPCWEKVMIFWRIKPLDKILETAEKKCLKRQLCPFQLTMLGIGAIIGTGIFVLTSVAAQKAGPGMMFSFIIAAVVCALTALIYEE